MPDRWGDNILSENFDDQLSRTANLIQIGTFLASVGTFTIADVILHLEKQDNEFLKTAIDQNLLMIEQNELVIKQNELIIEQNNALLKLLGGKAIEVSDKDLG